MYADTPVATRLSVAGLAIAVPLLTGAASIALFTGKLTIVVLIVGTLAVAVSLALAGNPRLYSLWGLILTAPMDMDVSFNVIPHMGGAAAYTIDLVDFFLVPLTLFLLRDFASGYRRHFRWSGFTVFWGALILLGLVSVALGPYRHVPLQEVVRMLKLLLLFLVFINEVVRVRQFKHVFAALMVGVALQCAVGLVQYLFDINLGAQALGEATAADTQYTSRATYLEDEFTYRVGALLGHPNLLAIYLAMILPIGIAMMFTRLSVLVKAIIGALVLVGILVLILTLSRSGWISFSIASVALLALSFLHPKARKRFIFARVGIISFGAVVAVALSGPIIKRIVDSDPGALEFRWEWMELAWRMIKANPTLGVGLNTFIFEMPPYSDYGTLGALVERFGPEQYLPVVHNIYLLVWSEQGTVGFILFMALNIYLFVLAWRNTKAYYDEHLYMINIGCFAGMLALAADGMVSFFIRNDACGRVFVLVAGLVVGIYYWRLANSRSAVEAAREAPARGSRAPLPLRT
jgi:O-antigen ligase